jgi:hypothetical protein
MGILFSKWKIIWLEIACEWKVSDQLNYNNCKNIWIMKWWVVSLSVTDMPGRVAHQDTFVEN